MSYYDNDNTWANQHRQPSWEQQQQQQQQQQQGPPRSGTNSAMSYQPESTAFAAQFEEIERATDNLMRSGKWLPGAGAGSGMQMPPRRESVSSPNHGFEHNNQHRGGPRHHQSNSEYDANRPGSAGLQNFYAGQRHPARQSEAEQMLQAKRRMAAQRERELRNYHQEQQYNRTSSSGSKPDRSTSPNAMSEEDRRELIARQHRALYGDSSSLYNADGSSTRGKSQDVSGRGASPFDGYNQAQPGADAVQMPGREQHKDNTSSSVSNMQQSGEASQHGRPSTTSPAASPPLQGANKAGDNTGVAPIGTRAPQNAAGAVGAMNKRSTTPLTPSSLSYGYSSAETQNTSVANDERSASAASNSQGSTDKSTGLGGSAWGNNSGVWGKTPLGNQASVWG